jgi:hypothetical protein
MSESDTYYVRLAHAVVAALRDYDMIHMTTYRAGYDFDRDFEVLANAIEQAEKAIKKEDSSSQKGEVKIDKPRTTTR